MPTFDYECKKCGKSFEEFQFPTEPDITKCIYCKGPVKRLVSVGTGIIFKGSGFYVTDSKKKSQSEKSKSAAPAAD